MLVSISLVIIKPDDDALSQGRKNYDSLESLEYERRRCKPGSDVPGDLSGKRTGRISFFIYLNSFALSLEVDFIGFFYYIL